MDINVIIDILFHKWNSISSVMEMGTYKTLIKFDSKEDMEHALQQGEDYLHNYFNKVQR